MKRLDPVRSDIVLVGGGHAHVHVVTAFAMRPAPGVRLTLITRELETPYSGMLPGMVAGLYDSGQAHIDLVRLTATAGTRLIHAEATGLDRANKRVMVAGRPPIAYDIISLDVGIVPALTSISGAAKHAIAVKPIGLFLSKLDDLIERAARPGGPRKIAVLGGGAGGVELLLSIRTRLLAEARLAGQDPTAFSFALVTDGEILATHNSRVRAAFRRIYAERGMALYENRRALAVSAHAIEMENGQMLATDAVLLTTDAAAPAWFCDTGLALDARGFITVTPTLQVANDTDIFAAGDCAALATPREKAGVYVVRAGPPLAQNLMRRVRGERLKPWRPQRHHLSLISTGERYAVASRGAFKAEGAWLWSVKDWIDRRWMRMYQDVHAITARMVNHPGPAVSANTRAEDAMRCGGCAAKIGPGPLSRALARMAPTRGASDVVIGLAAPDDAAVLKAPVGKDLVQTVDFFRAFIDDPYDFGMIAVNHALNDVFAMGGNPRFALATAVVPAGPSAKMEEDLFQLLAGARACLDREGVTLIGGHSSEGTDLALGLSVTGEIAPGRAVRKGGLNAGDALILTRPLGTGILFAAAMRARAKAPWIEAALREMRRSNREAALCLTAHGATAMTDVTGFGLIGHLGEMLAASGTNATVDLPLVPLYAGALALARAGIASTLLAENLSLAGLLCGHVDAAVRVILFDPQTSGGLLAGIPAGRAEACVRQLRNEGYASAAIIGRVTESGLDPRSTRITIADANLALQTVKDGRTSAF